jgi:hypothetical protein
MHDGIDLFKWNVSAFQKRSEIPIFIGLPFGELFDFD